MSISSFPPAAAPSPGGDGTAGNRNFKASVFGTYAVEIPAGVYDAQSKDLVANVVIGDTSWDGTPQRFRFGTTQTQIEFLDSQFDPDVWQTRLEVGPIDLVTVQLTSIISGDNDLLVAAGSSGYLATSTDSITWTTRTSGFGSTRIKDLVFGGGLYVAAGEGGTLTTSTDAVTWTTRTSGFGTSFINCVGFGDGIYLAGGQVGLLRTSTDGITWTARTSGVSSPGQLFQFAFGGGVYIFTATTGTIRYSTNAITWTTATSNDAALFAGRVIYAAAYGNGIFVAAGEESRIATSTNGITWTRRTPPISGTYFDLVFYDGLFLAGLTGGQIFASTDGITWTSRNSGFAGTIIGLAAAPEIYALVSGNLIRSAVKDEFIDAYVELEYKGEIIELV